ncbi:MAG: heme-binding protein, partial [Alphaproteobacteria bacterium]|nr:heme-binding protein [Alphaproteobacteria bacterium]
MKNFLAAAVLLLLTGCGMFEKYEEPAYRVVKKDDAIEWRAYEPFLMAEVTTTGARDAAANDGFRLLADYIFGGNEPQEKMAMTIPVTQQKQHDGWTVQFVMPLSRTLADLPKPTNSHVRLFQQPAKNMLAIRFSGTSAQS